MGRILHGIESAHYSNGYDGYKPVIVCECGFATRYGYERWQDVGEEYDQHLEDRKGEIAEADRGDE